MKNRSEYKVQAKRLGAAINSMFGVPCTSSQSLELLAKQENFPNWDALSGVAPASAPISQALPIGRVLGLNPLADLVKACEKQSGIVVLAGKVGTGKTSLLGSLHREMMASKRDVAPWLPDPLGYAEALNNFVEKPSGHIVILEDLHDLSGAWKQIVRIAEDKLVIIGIHLSSAYKLIENVPQKLIVATDFLILERLMKDVNKICGIQRKTPVEIARQEYDVLTEKVASVARKLEGGSTAVSTDDLLQLMRAQTEARKELDDAISLFAPTANAKLITDAIKQSRKDDLAFRKPGRPRKEHPSTSFVTTDLKDLSNPITADVVLANCTTKIHLMSEPSA